MPEYKITWGIHKRTLTSRDVGDPKEFNTEKEAIQWYKETKNWYAIFNYVFWFCTLHKPNGTKVTMEENSHT